MRILVADDDPTTLRLLERLLRSWGHDVIAVADGTAALNRYAEEEGIQALLLDWNMPGHTGLDVCRQLRLKETTRYTYVILLTSNAGQENILDAFEAGVDDYIVKPLNNHKLRARLKAAKRIIDTQDQLLLVHESLREQQLALEDLNHNLDQRVQAQTEELREAVAVAEKASAMKSMFLANMSHEIRTPLNGIVSYVELLGDSELNEEQRSDLKTISSCVQNLRGIINDVLDFSKIEAGMMLVDETPFNLSEIITETIRLQEATAAQAGLDLICTIEGDVPQQVIGDPTKLRQIITNLLSNAIKFTAQSRYVVVQVRKGTAPHHVVFSVTDCGPGVPPEKRESIFEAFTQADSSTTRKFGGTGLGLTICRKLAKLLSGAIWCQSRPGVGSCFILDIPLPPVTTADNSLVAAGATPETSPVSKRRKTDHPATVLLAEDDIINQKAMVRLLTAMGHTVTTAGTGNEVLKALQGPQKFDLVLMDIQMPELSGEEATLAIRKGQAGDPTIPIVILSANVMVTERERYYSIGAQGVLGKPINLDLLYQEIERQMGTL